MFRAWIESLLKCVHDRQTRPFTLNKTCYTVCLDCGRHMPYSWAEMRSLTDAECAGASQNACEEVRAAA